jgi:UDP-N-acetylglucosamine 2-epimerase (non-hydrolysing)
MKYILVAGARPNFMKVAPIMEAFRVRQHKQVLLVHTGQHYGDKMSDNFFADLQIPRPDLNLEVGSGSHAQQTARIMAAFEDVCIEHRPDWVIVVGDVNSTLACALVAKKMGIRVAHVEAGLRSSDMSMPEEINRLCTDAISDLLFTTDKMADENLRREGVNEARIRFVGNTMIDTLLRNIDNALSMPSPAEFEARQYAVLTLHRPSNVDSKVKLTGLVEALIDISRSIPIVFPAHPRTNHNLEKFGLGDTLRDSRIKLIAPLSYLPFIGLIARSRLVLTDSGGIQEETTVLGIPCITMRPTTERPITCTMGTNILVGTEPERIRTAVLAALNASPRKNTLPEKWDGNAATRIVDVLLTEPAGLNEPSRENTLREKWDGDTAVRIAEVLLNENSVSS